MVDESAEALAERAVTVVGAPMRWHKSWAIVMSWTAKISAASLGSPCWANSMLKNTAWSKTLDLDLIPVSLQQLIVHMTRKTGRTIPHRRVSIYHNCTTNAAASVKFRPSACGLPSAVCSPVLIHLAADRDLRDRMGVRLRCLVPVDSQFPIASRHKNRYMQPVPPKLPSGTGLYGRLHGIPHVPLLVGAEP